MNLHLVRLSPDPARLTAYAASAGVLPPGGDLGYGIHLALRNALGNAGPQPFRFFEDRAQLLAYTCDPQALEEAAALPAATPEIQAARSAIALEGLEMKSMPTVWRRGARYGFEVRLRPVRRVGKDKRSAERPGEHDAFGLAVRGLPREAWPTPQEVYLKWAEEKLLAGGVAPLGNLRVISMKRTEVVRRYHNRPDLRFRINGPDVVVVGTLEVRDPEAFATLLARGVGRHRAFGFGMLLLRPPRR